ncbi:excalibur calcium-binding domain-containing protein [Halobacillus sp. GSS1]|uniref:excalibur calcium-binding domain-containing protein n=1 Tax=Halobacillus sp. GSS1 TaxID=2815919 RepID=UPI001A90B11B|nr:excalibur calcium-binding domain-containing protein [Halobacillus sp. GSS1]MBN9653945.1 excalibur calcium-binding domain-containing protein [Halobacillus sp. GSS1]
MKRFLIFLFVLTLTFGSAGVVSADSHDGDKDCSDFDTTAEAEKYWEENGYDENNDPDRLDRDKDGVPCESLGNSSSADDSGDSEASEDEPMEDSEENGTQEESSEEEGGELPETATPYATYALLGMGLFLLSGGLLFVRREN